MLLSEKEKERYSRHLMLESFGEAAQLKLKNSRVLVVGAGGLGCPALVYLAAVGVGFIGIADDDIVSLSNLQRQVLYTNDDLGQLKTLIAEKRLSALNPNLQFCSISERIDKKNVLGILEDYDIIIDCTDNFTTRYLLNDACVILGKPLVYGAIFKFEGQVSVFNLADGPTYRCLFSDPPFEEASCSEVGVLGVLPGIVGSLQAAEAIKIITGIGQPLSGQLLSFNLLDNQFHIFRFHTIAANKTIREWGKYNEECSAIIKAIDAITLRQWLGEKDIQLIDVREQAEYAQYNIGGKNIPLSVLEKRIKEIDNSKLTVVHCLSGSRSVKAIQLIQSYYPSMVLFYLQKGISEFLKEVR